MKNHKELLPNNVGPFEENDVPDGFHLAVEPRYYDPSFKE